MTAAVERLRSLLRRVGGASAVSRPAFWVLLAVSLIAHTAEATTSGVPTRQLPVRAVFVVIAVVAAYGAMLLLRRLVLRDAAEQPRPWRALLIYVAAGVVRGVVLSGLLALVLDEPAQLVFRIGAAIAVLVPMLAITAAMVDVLREHAARRDELVTRNAELIAARDDALDRAAAERADAARRIQLLLADRLAALDAGPADAAARLRADVAEVIRPLSHRIVPAVGRVAAVPTDAAIRWREVWRDASLGRPIRPALGAIGFVATIPSLAARSPGTGLLPTPLDAIAGALCIGLCVFATLTLAARAVHPVLPGLRPVPRTALLAGTLLLALAVTAALSGFAVHALTGGPNTAITLSILTVGMLVAVLIALLQGIEHLLNAVDAELATTNAALEHEVARVNAVAWHQRNQLAVALHGPVQTAVTAAAMRLEQAPVGDAEALAAARELIGDAIGRLDTRSEHVDGIEVQLGELARAWDGLCAVTWTIEADALVAIDADATIASAVGDICTEACSNAVRHGAATIVEIAATTAADRLHLRIANDGADPGERRGGGLGSAMLDAVALAWRRGRVDGRTVLDVELALEPVGVPA